METLREIVLWIFGVSFFYGCGWELFRWIFVNKRFKEYADGLKTDIISKTGNQTDSKKTANLISAIFNND